VVESQPSKLLVAGSIPVSRSNLRRHAIEPSAAVGKPMTALKRSGQVIARVGDYERPTCRP
jgi:hypothetical protein